MNESPIDQVLALLPDGEAQQLAATLRHVEVPANTILLHEGDYGKHLYIVLKGQLEVVKALGTSDERSLGTHGPGEFVGEMSLLLHNGLRTASVRTSTPAHVLEMTRADFDALLQRHPLIAYQLARLLSMRLEATNNATIKNLQEKNLQLTEAYHDLEAAQARILEQEYCERELQVARERIEQELLVARRIQQALLPRHVPALPGWQITTYYQPAREVGGDFYDFLHLPNDKLGLVIGDVTDKGVPAALVMATTRSILRTAAHASYSPGEVLAHVNNLVYADIPPNMFVTCFYAILDVASGRLRYANAGHDLPYHRHSTGVTELRARGMPLGLMPDMCYEEKEGQLAPSDCVLFYSDGLVEAHNRQRELFSFGRLCDILANYPMKGNMALIDLLLDALANFTGTGWEQEDDITLVTLHRSATLHR
jgi:serine phosphatase RsbU (regulator of sigma subunit)